ncbi:hypothetical protein KI387_011015, partial [Taxus chinensis]
MSFSTFHVNKRYDVFLSFPGSNTCEAFVRKKLYPALAAAAEIHTFSDQISVDKGNHIFSSLRHDISASRICIPVFSQDFVESEWCLKALLYMVDDKATIWPLFYNVLPSALREDGKYVQDFEQHERRRTLDTSFIDKCKRALVNVSNRCGWCLNQSSGEEDLVQDIVSKVVEILKLKRFYLDTPECFGLDWPVDHVRILLHAGDMQKKMVKVGIHGMGGIGKTTLAKLVYKLICSQFEVFCYALDVGERCQEANGLVKLQTHMLNDISNFSGEVDHVDRGVCLLKGCLRDKRVLLLLDDIQSPEQLEALAGNYRDFGRGSRLIITSRDLQILKVADVDEAYEVSRLSHKHALQLFNFHTFPNSSCPKQEIETLRNSIIDACEGLPLALQVLGKSLVGERDRKVWVDMADKLSCEPSLQKKLIISYDSLDSNEKEMFQDIACFFNWTEKEMAIVFWEEVIRSLHASLRHLLQKSLVNMGPGNQLLMHACLRQLGKSIANEMSAEPRKRTRLFAEKDVHYVLQRHRENANHVRYLCYEPKQPVTLNAEMFQSLYNLRLLWLTNVAIEGNFPEACFLDLRWLRWRKCSSNSLPLGTNFESLVIMEVTDSQITHLWDESTEDYATIRPLKLKVLILSGCASLEDLPGTLMYTQLRILDLSNCNSLRSLPNSVKNFSSLVSLNMEGSGISSLPNDFGELSSLQKLNLSRCKHLSKLPSSFGNLSRLEKLQIHHNPKLTELPCTFGGLKSLLYLNAADCQLCDEGLPAGISELSSLKIIHLERNPFRSLPCGLEKLRELWELHLDGCKQLSLLPALPPSLEMLFARDCLCLDTLCCLSDLKSLSRLDVSKSPYLTNLPGLESLQGLTTLKLVGCHNLSSTTLESCLGGLKSLESLFIGGPGVSTPQLHSFYNTIKGITFKEQCLLATPRISSKWVNGEAY